jgi:integrase
MAWGQLDLNAATWAKPAAMTKQRRSHLTPLAPEAVKLLRRREAEREQGRVVRLKDDRVFPSTLAAPHFKLERDWVQIRASAGLDGLRMHDLRHTYASLLVGQGLSLPVIGALLGHSKPATTNRYAHLSLGPLRVAADLVGHLVTSGGKVTTK